MSHWFIKDAVYVYYCTQVENFKIVSKTVSSSHHAVFLIQ